MIIITDTMLFKHIPFQKYICIELSVTAKAVEGVSPGFMFWLHHLSAA